MNNFSQQLSLPTATEQIQLSSKQEMNLEGKALIDWFLNDQQQLTAVEQFSQYYSSTTQPAQEKIYQTKIYQSLIPAKMPEAGEQYAFEVNLDACSGCKACVTACHSLNGLDEQETWRDVGLLHGGTSHSPVMQHVTSACHHCLEPSCLSACPVDAYQKDEQTGIVLHLDDQCIGCQYCTLACPYDVPKYHPEKGIVRKCDMCQDRLQAGEAPACVQACPHEAISIQIVNQQTIITDSESNLFLPGAPEPQITLPTTQYKTSRVFPRNLLPTDYYSVQAEHTHWSLVVMLVFTQLSVGAFLVELILESLLNQEMMGSIRTLHTVSALVYGLLAMGVSTFHLGRPLYGFRAIIGLKHSWLSREIVAFGLFAFLAVIYALLNFIPAMGYSWLNGGQLEKLSGAFAWCVVLTGLVGVGCSVMVYAFTGREFWNGTDTSIRFLLTTALLGIVAAWMTFMLTSLVFDSVAARKIVTEHGSLLCQMLMTVTIIKLLFEAAIFRHLRSRQTTPLKRSAMLMVGELSHITLMRFCCGFLGGLFMPAFLLQEKQTTEESLFLIVVVLLMFVACVAGELLERALFFGAVTRPKMPGNFS